MKILDYVGMAPEPTVKPLRYVMYVRKSSEDAEAQAKHYQTKSRHAKNMPKRKDCSWWASQSKNQSLPRKAVIVRSSCRC